MVFLKIASVGETPSTKGPIGRVGGGWGVPSLRQPVSTRAPLLSSTERGLGPAVDGGHLAARGIRFVPGRENKKRSASLQSYTALSFSVASGRYQSYVGDTPTTGQPTTKESIKEKRNKNKGVDANGEVFAYLKNKKKKQN